ncbi:lytic transglycosylase domain-containing protein [Kitasatospora sp. NPDC090091]|uniref:lytic transglycosylase domain-containing protein n=1 Tax=Kitasatospora sp. NPDC090091 TaxID=3364081 RepID=UPI0037FA338E
MSAALGGDRRTGHRLRLGKRMAGTAAVFTALAALTGSQVTGLGLAPVAAADTPQSTGGATATRAVATTVPGAAVPTLPNTPGGPGTPVDGGGTVPLPQPPTALPGDPSAGPFRTGPALPETVFAAYRQAETALAQRSPGCHLPWQLLAAIGEVESGQADRGAVDAGGTTYRPILGPVLDGKGFAAIPDTDGGRHDGDRVWDRAVGPMQFIPSTWASWGVDANGDGTADPNNIFDAAQAAGRYLCAGGRDLADPAQLDRAILGYNHSDEYLRTVKNWMAHFGTGTATTVPNRPAPAATGSPTAPAAPVPPGASVPSAPAPSTAASPSPAPATASPSAPPSASASPSASTSPSGRPSPSASTSPSATPTGTPTGTPTATPGGTPTATPTGCPVPTPSATGTPNPTASPSATATATAGATPTATPSATATASPTAPGCPSPSPTPTASASAAASPAAAPSANVSPSAAPSPSAR